MRGFHNTVKGKKLLGQTTVLIDINVNTSLARVLDSVLVVLTPIAVKACRLTHRLSNLMGLLDRWNTC